MDVAIDILLLVFALAGSGTAFFGETLKKGKRTPAAKRITPVGYAALLCLLFSFALGVWKELREGAAQAGQEAETKVANDKRKESEENIIKLQTKLATAQEQMNLRFENFGANLERLAADDELDVLLRPHEKSELINALRTGERILGLAEIELVRKRDELLARFQESGEARPKWLEVALKEKGQAEKPGDADDNPRIIEYLNITREMEKPFPVHDEIPWTSAFASWALEQAGIRGPRTTNPGNWPRWIRRLEKPRLGCIVVSRGPGTGDEPRYIHFFCGEDGDHVLVFGGNIRNSVDFKALPKAQVYGYGWPPTSGDS